MNPLVLVTYTLNPGGDRHTDLIDYPSPIASVDDLSRLSGKITNRTKKTVWAIVSWQRFEDEPGA